VPSRVHRERLAPAGWNPHVHVAGIRSDAVDRTLLAPEAPAHDAHARTVVVGHVGDRARGHVLVARCGHLERRGQVRPELEPVHAAFGVALWHLLMEDAATGGHPLDVTRAEIARVAEAVAV